ncbi:MAG: DUF1850 domain-containing protein [Treponema sp.]|nr:DUF1850 domain-containing protein [Candidatus Treponema equifaecale]
MKKVIPGILALILVAAGLNLPLIKVVSISNRKNVSESIYSRPALQGFVISYTHSVNKGRIHDHYVCDGDQLILEKSVFVSYGAGIPEPEEIADCQFELTEDGYVLNKLNKRLDSFLMAVGVIAEHSVTISGKEYFLKNFFPVQTSLRFQVKRVSAIKLLRTRSF